VIEQAIARHGGQRGDEGRLVSRYVRRIARLIGIPSFGLMLAGLVVEAVNTLAGARARFPGPPVAPFASLFDLSGLSANWLLSIGLLGLCLAPVVNILAILVHHLRARHWIEAAVSLLVIGILLLSLLLGKG
jgi:hypothetical protein